MIEHERVHLHRQKELGLLKWLLKYLLSPKFRVGEELLAIKSQLKYLIENQISFELEKMASDLSGPTYLWAIRYDRAIKNLRDLEAEIARSV